MVHRFRHASALQQGLGATAIFALVILAALPYLTSQSTIALCSLALVFSVFAVSVNVLSGLSGLVTLGHAGIFASGAYGTAYMSVKAEQPVFVQIATGVGVAMAVSFVFGLLAMRTSGVYFIMVTLAQGMIVWGLAIRLNDITGAFNGLSGVRRPAAITPDWIFYYVCLIAALAAMLVYLILSRSPFGLSLRALRDGEQRGRMLGYNPAIHKFYAFMIAGTLAGIAGILYVYLNGFMSASASNFPISGQVVLMVIIGGTGTLTGPMIGAFVIVLGQNYASTQTDRWNMILGVMYILVILFAREGLMGLVKTADGEKAGKTIPTPAADTAGAVRAGGSQ